MLLSTNIEYFKNIVRKKKFCSQIKKSENKMSNCGPHVDPRDPEKPEKPEVRARGGAGLTFLGLGVS